MSNWHRMISYYISDASSVCTVEQSLSTGSCHECCRISFVGSFKVYHQWQCRSVTIDTGQEFTVAWEWSSDSLYHLFCSCLAEAPSVNANERSSCWPLGTATDYESWHCFQTSNCMISERPLAPEQWNSRLNQSYGTVMEWNNQRIMERSNQSLMQCMSQSISTRRPSQRYHLDSRFTEAKTTRRW